MVKRKIPEVISEKEFNLIQKDTKKLKIKLAERLGFYNCLRVSEIVNLKPENIDMASGFIHIKEGKGCKDRDVPIMKPVKHYLRYLPVNVSRQALHKTIKTKGKKILNKKIYFHTLRHSGASMYLNEKKVDISFIKQLLGHESISTTQIYLHTNPSQLKNTFDNVWKDG